MNFQEIKTQYSCIEVAQQLGIQLRQVSSDEYRGTSLMPGEHSHDDGLSVKTEEWFDFTGNIGGSVLDLVALVKFGSTSKEAICKAAKFLSGNDYDAHYWNNYTSQRDTFRANVKAWHEALLQNEQVLDYLHSRRINDETIERFSIGLYYESIRLGDTYVQEWRLPVAYDDANGQPVYMVSRAIPGLAHEGSPKYHKCKQNEFLKNCPFGLDTIPAKKSERDILLIGEGLFDALSVMQERYAGLFSIGGDFGKENTEQVLKTARTFRRVFTCFDNDANLSGQRFTCRMGMRFLHAGVFFKVVESYGEGHKDVSDYYCAGGNLEELMSRAVNGYAFMSRYTFWEKTPQKLNYSFDELSADDKAVYLSEVKKFVRRLKSFLSNVQLAEVIDTLKEYYPIDTLNKFLEPPTKQEVLCSMRDEFLDGKRRIIFHGSIKGGEYWQYDADAGYWHITTDADLQAQISAHFMHSLDNKTIFQLATMIRIFVTRPIMPTFNQQPIEVFTNGTLEKFTGKFREHRAEDYATWRHGFAYDENAVCPTYDKFIEQVAVSEQSRIDFLDDITAYTMHRDCNQQKIFFLIGEGNNGKSTFLQVLEDLYASDNLRDNVQSVTHIQPSSLDKPTELIMLKSSVLNVCSDISYNLKGAEPFIKALAGGEALTGNYKFHDTCSFTPLCKLVCSSNRMIVTGDNSYGLRRRLMFCNFTADFTDCADTSLPAKLKAELPGIFNRAYRSYKALLERMKTQGTKAIRETIDQKALITEFQHIADPVSSFWDECGEEYVERGEAPTANVFDDFRNFCERNSLHAGSAEIFGKSLERLLKDNGGITLKKTRHREHGKQVCYYTFIKLQQAIEQQVIEQPAIEQQAIEQQVIEQTAIEQQVPKSRIEQFCDDVDAGRVILEVDE